MKNVVIYNNYYKEVDEINITYEIINVGDFKNLGISFYIIIKSDIIKEEYIKNDGSIMFINWKRYFITQIARNTKKFVLPNPEKRYNLIEEELFKTKDKYGLCNEPQMKIDKLIEKYISMINYRYSVDNEEKFINLTDIIDEFKNELSELMKEYYVDTF